MALLYTVSPLVMAIDGAMRFPGTVVMAIDGATVYLVCLRQVVDSHDSIVLQAESPHSVKGSRNTIKQMPMGS